MEQYISKSALVAEIWKRRIKHREFGGSPHSEYGHEDDEILGIIDTLEVIDPYKQYIQYASIEAGIKAHAEDYSFNIESELFQQLTEEQQKLWRKEIEQACISGGYAGVELARDPRYKENLEVKEVDLEKNLTWKDICAIDYLLFDIKNEYDNGKLSKEEYYESVLRKFKAQK